MIQQFVAAEQIALAISNGEQDFARSCTSMMEDMREQQSLMALEEEYARLERQVFQQDISNNRMAQEELELQLSINKIQETIQKETELLEQLTRANIVKRGTTIYEHASFTVECDLIHNDVLVQQAADGYNFNDVGIARPLLD